MINRYKTQNTKGIKGISEFITMFKWKIQFYKLKLIIYDTSY